MIQLQCGRGVNRQRRRLNALRLLAIIINFRKNDTRSLANTARCVQIIIIITKFAVRACTVHDFWCFASRIVDNNWRRRRRQSLINLPAARASVSWRRRCHRRLKTSSGNGWLTWGGITLIKRRWFLQWHEDDGQWKAAMTKSLEWTGGSTAGGSRMSSDWMRLYCGMFTRVCPSDIFETRYFRKLSWRYGI